MTARTDAQARHERYFGAVLEIDLDACANTFGVSPCTAGRVQSGTAQAGASTSITLAAGASSTNDAYKGMTIRTTGGTGSGQERVCTAYNGTTKVATVDSAWGTTPNNTTTYDVINRPQACYNTFATCQDKPNYVKGTKTYKFCSRGMRIPPGELVRPYIAPGKDGVDCAATEVDPNYGLARSSKTTITLADEPTNDYDADPYYASRTAPAASTFFARLLARNTNYVGRWARLRLGYPVTPWDWNTFQTELYVVDSITLKDGATIVLKDPIKLADNTKLPAPTDGTLTAGITSSATSLTVASGKGAQYGSSGYIRLGDEIIQFTSRATDTLSWPDTTYRGKFNTTAAAHSTNDKVQICLVYSATALTDVVKDLLNQSGVSNTYIDTAQMASEDTRWLSTKYQITVCLSEPTAPSTYIAELCREANAMLWWHPAQQKFKFKVNMPESSTSSTPYFDESANLIEKSVAVEVLDAERLTYGAVFCNLATATINRNEDKNYLFGAISIDTNAESANEYNDRRVEVIRSRFLQTANSLAVIALSGRMVAWRRDPPFKLKVSLDPKDYTVAVGDLIDVNTRKLVDPAGQNKTARVRVVKLLDRGTHVEVEARSTRFRNRYGFIAPNGTPAYPTDQVYAHICRAAGAPSQTMTNGDAPYLII